MRKLMSFFIVSGMSAYICIGTEIPVSSDTIAPGTEVHRGNTSLKLSGTPIEVGKAISDVKLLGTDMKEISLLELAKDKVLLISIVPSVDTPVCEEQTHILGEEKELLPDSVVRITISRDLPFAQKRFATESKLDNILYLSDFRDASFGKSVGLFMPDNNLLARSVIVVDSKGIVRYLQVVPQLGHLPDMKKAFEEAKKLASSN